MQGNLLLVCTVGLVYTLPQYGGRSRGPKPTKSVAQLLDQEQVLNTFSRAIKTAGLQDMLDGPDFVTVFAPTNEAFENVSEKVLEDEEKVKSLVSRHIIPGFPRRRVDLPAGDSTHEDLSGATVTVTKSSDNQVSVRTAEGGGSAVRHDVVGTNGVLYWVNGVL